MNDSNLFNDWKSNKKYFMMLSLIGRLSNLFSESAIPFIHYRITENLFCKYCNAENLSRTDTAYDAKIGSLGIGIKTFILENDFSTEKIAEFNSLASYLSQFRGKELAKHLAICRNQRIQVANDLYNINQAIYHIIGRKKNAIEIFNTSYDFIDVDNIEILKDSDVGLHFSDGINVYNYNRSKSVLMKKFFRSKDVIEIPIEILSDPYQLLEKLFSFDLSNTTKMDVREKVILPLYSTKNRQQKEVPIKSGLNQWNAGGRLRDEDEVYISVPKDIHKNKPYFFPARDTSFVLRLPDGEILSAKLCQSESKALMSNPNRALGFWILRKILKLPSKTIVTMEHLNKVGFDSIVVYKNKELDYSIDVCYSESFFDFVSKF
jgi:hypothetical protein